jgi:hypothetical protein
MMVKFPFCTASSLKKKRDKEEDKVGSSKKVRLFSNKKEKYCINV